ncbi:hypothetical protein EMIT0232MI5_80109 [Pseudomonas sp. IT-232MI5]
MKSPRSAPFPPLPLGEGWGEGLDLNDTTFLEHISRLDFSAHKLILKSYLFTDS